VIAFTENTARTDWQSFGPLEAIGAQARKGDVKHCGVFEFGCPSMNISVGIWECTSGEFEITYPFNEGFTIVEGNVTIIDILGNAVNLKAGDSLFAEKNEQAVWIIHSERVRKVFFICVPQQVEQSFG
jgi:uncharacterized protein